MGYSYSSLKTADVIVYLFPNWRWIMLPKAAQSIKYVWLVDYDMLYHWGIVYFRPPVIDYGYYWGHNINPGWYRGAYSLPQVVRWNTGE